MKKTINAYKNYLDGNYSENTEQSYLCDLEKFFNAQGIEKKKDLLKVKNDSIEEYIASLENAGLSQSSILRSVAALRNFFGYCTGEGIVKNDPTRNLQVPKAQKKLPITMSDEEVVKLLEAPDITTIKGIRDRAMFELMYATGARVSELVNLKIGDVSLKNEFVILITGKKTRYVPIGKIAIEALYEYLQKARGELANESSSNILFLNFYGQPISRQGVWKIVKGYIEECNLNPGITVQSLRHSFAVHMIRNGADTHSVSEMLGYSDASSVKKYIEVLNNNIRDIYKKSHPRA
jgi:integrase/recombinase XerD